MHSFLRNIKKFVNKKIVKDYNINTSEYHFELTVKKFYNIIKIPYFLLFA